jgi:hypothetical protein
MLHTIQVALKQPKQRLIKVHEKQLVALQPSQLITGPQSEQNLFSQSSHVPASMNPSSSHDMQHCDKQE